MITAIAAATAAAIAIAIPILRKEAMINVLPIYPLQAHIHHRHSSCPNLPHPRN